MAENDGHIAMSLGRKITALHGLKESLIRLKLISSFDIKSFLLEYYQDSM